ncbi:MAG: DUF4878 domain-containing protein [Fimbriimonadaceae bacterium]|nr:DUF4878 domain-containing protein [Chitinophagales bacterium]
MKKVIIPVLAIFAVLFIASCASSGTPEATVKSFLSAVNDKKWDEAKKYATPESESLLEMIKGFSENAPDSTATMKFDVVKDKTKIEGETAEVTVKDDNEMEMAYKLKKIDGKWKVDFTMEALMGDMNVEDVMDDAMKGMEDMGDDITIEGDTSMMDMPK